jgi:hypothetical protein
LKASITALSAIDGLDASVKAFYQRQQFRAHCNYFAFLEPVNTLAHHEQFVKQVGDDFCAMRQELTAGWRSESCGKDTIAWRTWCPGE